MQGYRPELSELHDGNRTASFRLAGRRRRAASRLKDGRGDATTAAISIRDQIEALQGHNRRILAHLRRWRLEELGLIEALRALVEQWRKDEPNVALGFGRCARRRTGGTCELE